MSRRYGHMMQNMKKTFIHKDNVRTILEKVDNILKEVVPKILTATTDGIMKDTLPWLVVDAVKKERESAPKTYMQNTILNVHQSSTSSISNLQQQLYLKIKNDRDSQAADSAIRDALKKKYEKSSIVWESRQEDVTPQVHEKRAQVFQGCERDPNDPTRYLYNKDLFFLKNGNTKARMYVLSLHKIHATSFLEDDLEEVLKRWVDLIDEVCVKKSDDKVYIFSKSDFKYLNKNDIEDMYYICMRRRNNPQQTALIKALIVFIRSCVIWETVHDFQMGIEADPFVGIVYENGKKEKRAMNVDELQKFSDATLKRVLRKISAINVKARHSFKNHPLNEKDKELMILFEEEIEERLKYRRQMRRWESFVNGRPISNYIVRPK
ncbi:hypothetical protein Tco_0246177 [Tanacetum coccineum]